MLKQEQGKHNILYFESSTMRELYETMKNWQKGNSQRFLSLSIQPDCGNFCCIALVSTQQPSTEYQDAMAKFQRKALKHIGVAVSFDHPAIPSEKSLRIQFNLAKCKTPTEVKNLFRDEL